MRNSISGKASTIPSSERGFLADAHTLIWWWDDDARLPRAAMMALEERRTPVYVSAAVGWELATKYRIGKLPQMEGRIHRYEELILADGFQHLAVQPQHGVRAGLLAGAHRDPFDRIQAAQSLMEGLTMVTRDPAFAAFGCKVIW